MKTIYEPSVYLMGRQQVDDAETSRFLADHGVSWETDTEVGAEALCETAGRVCYMSYAKPRPGGNRAYLDHILQTGHGSVLEHAVWNFLFTGVSRSLTHELVRHRAGWGYSQLSQRYVDESVAEFVVPPSLRREVEAARVRRALVSKPGVLSDELLVDTEFFGLDYGSFADLADAGDVWLEAVERSQKAYVWLSGYLSLKAPEGLAKTDARKYARQAARSVLPNATETKVFCTANARALRHFFEMRASRFADPEIRKLAYALWQVMKAEAPNLFGDYLETVLPDGTTELTTTHQKV